MTVSPDQTFARRIHEERTRAGISQAALAAKMTAVIGRTIDASAVARAEKYERAVRLDEAVAIADLFQVPLAAMLRDLDRLKAPDPDSEIPEESVMLKNAYRMSGRTAVDLAAGTGMSVAAVHIALNGIRYRDGKARVAIPTDAALVKLAHLLHIRPDDLRARGRVRAADLLEQKSAMTGAPPLGAGPMTLSQRVLAAFATDELQDEVDRRNACVPANIEAASR